MVATTPIVNRNIAMGSRKVDMGKNSRIPLLSNKLKMIGSILPCHSRFALNHTPAMLGKMDIGKTTSEISQNAGQLMAAMDSQPPKGTKLNDVAPAPPDPTPKAPNQRHKKS